LNSRYTMLPFGDLDRQRGEVVERFGVGGSVFVRPSSGFKTFTGVVVGEEDWSSFIRHTRADPETLVVVSPPADVKKEWRAVVVNGEIVTAGQYKQDGKDIRCPDVPQEVYSYGRDVVEFVKYRPDPAWTLDICETAGGDLKVLEVGSFSCAGLYACDCEAVVRAVNFVREDQ
jgi:hypothetical protein